MMASVGGFILVLNIQVFLKKENDEMDKKLKYNKIELEACYNVIKDFTEKNARMEKILKERLGIDCSNLYKGKF